MFTLIGREIRDNITLFIIAMFISMIGIIAIVMNVTYNHDTVGMTNILTMILSVFQGVGFWIFVLCAAFGSLQIYGDREKKMSAFLCTLAATRRTIFTAKILAGVFLILAALLPLVITAVIILVKLAPELMSNQLVKVFIIGFVNCLLSYSLGLRAGLMRNKILGVLYFIFGALVFLSLFIIKGVSTDTIIILAILICSSIYLVYQKFISDPL
jgi:ABC-type transport system involved in multi-copper enzyme maturation permease subunit